MIEIIPQLFGASTLSCELFTFCKLLAMPVAYKQKKNNHGYSFFYAFFAISAISVNAFGSVTAISANIFLLMVTFAFLSPAIILL